MMLNYRDIEQQYRSNSIIEAYNARIKLLLPYKPNFPKFINFMLNEESYYNSEVIRKISQGESSYTNISFPKSKDRKSSLKKQAAYKNSSPDGNWIFDGSSSDEMDDELKDYNTDSLPTPTKIRWKNGSKRRTTPKKSLPDGGCISDGSSSDEMDNKLDVYNSYSLSNESTARKKDVHIGNQKKPKESKSKLKRSFDEFRKDKRRSSGVDNIPKKISKKARKQNDTNLINELEGKRISWNLTNYKDSCRYSSFWTLYRFKLYSYHNSFRTISKLKGSSWLNKLINLNNDLMNTNKLAAIESFANYNNTTNLEMDQFGKVGSVTPLFRIFSCLKICKMEITDTKNCNHCGLAYPPVTSSIGPLFSLSGNILVNSGIENSLNSHFSPSEWNWECCKKDSDMLTKREVKTLPSLLFVVLDFSKFTALKNFKKYDETITLNEEKFNLCAAITKPMTNHFALLMKDPDALHQGWYEYDDCKHNGDIVPVTNEIKSILANKHGYILIFEREQDLIEE